MTLRILFVDDEENVLQGLERMLRPMRSQWEMSFASNGKEALEMLSREPFDVIVSDMRMPGMDGADLLKEVMQRHPNMIRLVLSGHSDKEMILKSVGPTHQFLTKPCDAETLKAALNRSFALRDLLTNSDLISVVANMGSLPSLPTLYSEIMRELQTPGASIKQVGEIIAKDVGMTAKILQLVNSAFFGLPRHISSPAQAASLLGLDIVRALVLSIQVFSEFRLAEIEGFSIESLWQHSINVSHCARRIAKAAEAEQRAIDDSLLAGLLHDVGKLILAANYPDRYQKVLAFSKERKLELWLAEKEVIGSSHAEIGAYLMGLWGLPDSIVETLAFHHRPSESLGDRFSALTAVHTANALIREEGEKILGIPIPQPDIEYLDSLGLGDRLPVWRKTCHSPNANGEE